MLGDGRVGLVGARLRRGRLRLRLAYAVSLHVFLVGVRFYVTLPADLAVVLLLAGVVAAVHGEVGGGAEALLADAALEQLLAGVLAGVHAQLRARRAALQAYWAREPLVPSMCDHMVVPGGGGGEAREAYLAAVGLLARVRAAVVDQRRLLREAALAVLALVWTLTSMHSHVRIKLGHFIEALVTHGAHVVPNAAMLLHVLAQRRVTAERLVAFRTF